MHLALQAARLDRIAEKKQMMMVDREYKRKKEYARQMRNEVLPTHNHCAWRMIVDAKRKTSGSLHCRVNLLIMLTC